MKYLSIKHLLSKTIALSIIALFAISCGKGEREVISSYSNGNPKLVYYTKTNNGVKTRVYEQMYYENGKIRYKGSCLNTEKNGTWKYYYENGRKFAQCDFTNSKAGKKWTLLSTDGNKFVDSKDSIAEIVFYYDGCPAAIRVIQQKKETLYKFFPSFKTQVKCAMKGNILNGPSLSYFENGNINSKNYYRDGMQEGEYVLYYDNGSVRIKGNYSKDKQVDSWQYFKSNGQPDGEEVYSNEGKLIKARNTGLHYYGKDGKELKM
jgi:Uncharacterized protein conserved in bacteria